MAFVTALNIGSQGLFWWYIPRFTSKFYDRLYDIENKAPFELQGNPSPAPVWGKTEPLNGHDIVNAQAVYIYIRGSERHNPAIFEHYFRGLALLMKSDFFYPFGAGSLQEFYLAFQMFCKEQGLWDGKTRFEDAVISNAHVSDDPTFRRLAALTQNVIDNPTGPAVVTGNDAAVMKMYFDSVLIKCAREFLKDRWGKHVENDNTSDLGG